MLVKDSISNIAGKHEALKNLLDEMLKTTT